MKTIIRNITIFIIKNLVLPIRRLYWLIFHPKTYGVKAIIPNPKNYNQILLIRNSYDKYDLWNIPGGGYNPKKETAIEANIREIREELSVRPFKIKKLGEYKTISEGKDDNVSIFLSYIKSDKFKLSYEISEIMWLSIDEIDKISNITKIALYSINLYIKYLNFNQ